VEIVKTLSEIATEATHCFFGQLNQFKCAKTLYLLLLLDKLKEITACTVLKNDPQMIPRLIPVEEAEYMSVLQIVKDTHL
jgi:hypothetical protein